MRPKSQWFGLGLVLVLLGIIVLLATDIYTFIPSIVGSFGAILIASGTIEIGLVLMTAQEIRDTVESSVQENLNKPLTAFYQDRRERVDLRETVEDAEALWLAWISGGRVTIENIANSAKQDADLRLILLHPESNAIPEVDKVTEASSSIDKLRGSIRATTEAALDSGFEVRWLREPYVNSVNIINPNREGALAELDVFLSFGSPEERPTVVVSPDSGSVLFDRLKETYEEQMWANAEQPVLDTD